MSQSLLRINSIDKKPESESNSDFKYNFGNANIIQQCNRITIKSVDVPNVFYNVVDNSYADKTRFRYKIAGFEYSIAVPAGQYTMTQLIAKLETAMVAVGLTITIDDITGKLKFLSTTDIEYLNWEDGNNGMALLLGITKGSIIDVANWDAGGLPDLSGVQEIYITSTELTDGTNLITNDGRSLPVLIHIPMTVSFGNIEHWRSYSHELDFIKYLSYDSGKPIRDISIQVRDQHGAILDLQGLNFNIILDAHHNL